MIIKSRAWVKPKGIFYYDFAKVPYDVKMEGIVYRCFSGRMDKGSLYEFDFKENLFTGVQDKNGRDVYEGDILENYHSQKFEIVYGLNKKEIVSHNSSQQKRRPLGSGFYERQIGKEINSYIILLDANWGKIIGNIYENPELIEASK